MKGNFLPLISDTDLIFTCWLVETNSRGVERDQNRSWITTDDVYQRLSSAIERKLNSGPRALQLLDCSATQQLLRSAALRSFRLKPKKENKSVVFIHLAFFSSLGQFKKVKIDFKNGMTRLKSENAFQIKDRDSYQACITMTFSSNDNIQTSILQKWKTFQSQFYLNFSVFSCKIQQSQQLFSLTTALTSGKNSNYE